MHRATSPSPAPPARARAARRALVSAALLAAAACGRGARVGGPAPAAAPALIPLPSVVRLTSGPGFVVDRGTAIVVDAAAPAAVDTVAARLAEVLVGAVAAPPRRLAAGEPAPARGIHLRLDPALDTLGAEGYTLDVAPAGVTIAALAPAGLFYGVQTLRQLLPASVEHPAALNRVLRVPAGRIADRPRFAWRGAMLDVARHFLPAADVKRFVDLLALYKLNRLHLHLSDDQGWRVEIRSWPELARVGGSTQVGGGPGGFYTQAELADLAAYAAERHVTIVPEIDVPGHTNAALAAYPGLNCDGVAPPLYTGTRVGFSTVCVDRDSVYRFVDDVVREIGALVPTPYFHVGGDEVERLSHDQYLRFVERVQAIVRARGKRMIGWGEVAPAALHPETVVQHWKPDSSARHAARGGRVILSPSRRLYLDMKYDSATVLGLRWAALVEVRDAYDWEPATYLAGVPEAAVLGVEAPLWSETLVRRADYEFMAFPRLAAVAEVGWSRADRRRWDRFRVRLGAHGPRLAALGVNYYRSPQVPWQR